VDRWTTDEDSKLKDAVQRQGGKGGKRDWVAIAALVPGRTRKQCTGRWYSALDPSIGRTAGRAGAWTEDEDNKLRVAVQMHGGKDWAAIAALVPGRTRKQCTGRWYSALNPSIDRTAGRAGAWTEDGDNKLKVAVQMHGGKDWAAIAALVPGRAIKQCTGRWYSALDPSIDRTAGRAGAWTEDEDNKLKVAVQMHGGKDWAAIAALVPGRTKDQCSHRWHDFL
jgi:predicted PP-loop superfamily ATPase